LLCYSGIAAGYTKKRQGKLTLRINSFPKLNMQKNSDYFMLKSIRKSNWAKKTDASGKRAVDLSGATGTTLLAMLLTAHVGGVIYDTQKELADIVGCSEPTITKGLKALLEAGLIQRIEGKRGRYRITSVVGRKDA
jgi:predicted HTH transcriptional regulator